MDPLLIDVPERIETENLVLRSPRRGDGPIVNAAVHASLDELGPWLPWAGAGLSVDESEANCRRQQAKFILREDFVFLIFDRRGRRPGRRAARRHRPAPDRLDPAPVRDRLLAQDRLRRPRHRHRGDPGDGAARLRFARRPPRRAAHGRQQRAQLEGRRARRLHARGAASLRRRQLRAASRAARGSMRGCGARRSRSARRRRRKAEAPHRGDRGALKAAAEQADVLGMAVAEVVIRAADDAEPGHAVAEPAEQPLRARPRNDFVALRGDEKRRRRHLGRVARGIEPVEQHPANRKRPGTCFAAISSRLS